MKLQVKGNIELWNKYIIIIRCKPKFTSFPKISERILEKVGQNRNSTVSVSITRRAKLEYNNFKSFLSDWTA